MKFTCEVEVDVTVESGDSLLVTSEHAHKIVRSVLARGAQIGFLLEDGLMLSARLKAARTREVLG